MLTRRQLLAALPLAARCQESLPPVRAITRGPGYHWFGYYDKLQFDPTGRYALGMRVDFEHRSPRPEDEISLGMIDLQQGDRWRELGRTRAWNWQQGAMLQWIPGSRTSVIWNDRQGERFVSVILDTRSGKRRTLPNPIYALSPDGRWAIYPDFRRLNDMRPGYGYAGLPDPNAAHPAPPDAGLWRMNLATGKSELLMSFADAVRVPDPHNDTAQAKHWFNHLLYSTDGSRFVFLHRWRGPRQSKTGFGTRMFSAAADGSDRYVIDPYGRTSHFIWRDPRHVLAWTGHPSREGDRFFLLRDKSTQVEVIGEGVMTVNGHCTYLPGNRFILNDTYPDKERLQHPYLFEVATSRRIPLGHFHSPPEYKGEWRCDLHPRFSPDGRQVIVDSPHAGGRQMYLIDIARAKRESGG